MSTKPATVPRWANVGGLIVTPPSGKLDIGHLTGEKPPAQYENWWKNLTYLWCQYLSDGAFQGASSFDTTITMAANQHVILSGTGLIKHGTYTLSIPIIPSGLAAASPFVPGQAFSGVNATWVVGIPLQLGKQITAVRGYVKDNATGPTKITASLSAGALTGATPTIIASSAASAGTGATQTLTISGLTTTMTTGNGYYVQLNLSTGSASCTMYGVEVDFTQP